MNTHSFLYRENLSLLTDLYQLTMSYAAWKTGHTEKEGVFDLYFRHNPFQSGYAIHCGLDSVLNFIENFKFDKEQTEYLASLEEPNGNPIFEKDFLSYLRQLQLNVNIDAIEEGRVVFAGEPLYRVQGPLLQCQLLETSLLNLVNFETLIATKASRVKEAAGSDLVLEFGLRRAQGIDGSISAARACYVGGADATSNVLAGKLFGIPVRGTHAHSWVMAFDDETEAFLTFAKAMPNNCIFLVDTYNSLEGIKHAITVGQWLKQQGHQLLGIRLDSGDLAYLSIEARKLLDEAGFKEAVIVASSDLDENLILSLKQQGAKIDIWGVGTKLVTAYDQPALGGIYKLTAMKEKGGQWKDRIKLSEQLVKITHPGIHQVRRFYHDGLFAGDMIYDIRHALSTNPIIVHPHDITRRKQFSLQDKYEGLLIPVVRKGKIIYKRPSLEESRAKRAHDLKHLHPSIHRFLHPHEYPVGLELGLLNHKQEMILALRGFKENM